MLWRVVGGDRKLALAGLDRELAERVDVVADETPITVAPSASNFGDRLGELVRLDRAADRERRREEVEDHRSLGERIGERELVHLAAERGRAVKFGAASPTSSAA